MIQAIVFDWGGVFTDGTFDSSAVRNFAKLFSVTEEEIASTYYPLMANFEIGSFDINSFHRYFSEHSGLESDAGVFQNTFFGSVVDRLEMFKVLASIPDTYLVGMLSNNVPVLCDRVRGDPRLSRINRNHFVFSNEIGVRKPDPLAFSSLINILAVLPEEVAFIDDNAVNISSCERMGCTGIHIPNFEAFRANWSVTLPELFIP
jgi:putative hydrolase of the HAD superfamily